MPANWNSRLARTPYLAIPRLAIAAMPQEWQDRMEQLLQEADDAGMETPAYYVFRDLTYADDSFQFGVKDVGDHGNPHYVFGGRKAYADPWANYRHGKIDELCPTFAQRKAAANELAVRTQDAYSCDLFADGEWEKAAQMLLARGYSDEQSEGILRSKWTRWCRDSFCDDEHPRGEAWMLAAFIDEPRNNCTEEQVNDLIC